MRDHQDPRRRLEALAALQQEYGLKVDPLDLWEAHIAGRDHEGAAELLNAVQVANLPTDVWAVSGIPGIELAQAITYGFLDAQDRLAAVLIEARAKLDSEPKVGLDYWGANRDLALAFVTAESRHALCGTVPAVLRFDSQRTGVRRPAR